MNVLIYIEYTLFCKEIIKLLKNDKFINTLQQQTHPVWKNLQRDILLQKPFIISELGRTFLLPLP